MDLQFTDRRNCYASKKENSAEEFREDIQIPKDMNEINGPEDIINKLMDLQF